ncbi:endolytic transglycosylase MltG [Zongyangia hominis]|uniref:Endolytic murein transglycosylase n=1 Tax=Zongyangia hominis TaxID=2763677 RepID=A0A926ECJ8_9FIRM|nr:endolytic transglycosylase MltG [Zongyangia hominis]MBC8569884.1 endolytic transglycosylase MltG [Zongyangia hominis]
MDNRDDFDELMKKFSQSDDQAPHDEEAEGFTFQSGVSSDKYEDLPLFQEEYSGPAQSPKEKKAPFKLNITDREYYEIPDTGEGTAEKRRPSPGKSGPGEKSASVGKTPGPVPRAVGETGKAQSKSRIRRRYESLGRTARVFIYIGFVMGISLFLSYFILQGANDLFGFNKQDMQVEITVPENASVSDVAKILKKSGVISEPTIFTLYAQSRNDEETKTEFKPGTYVLNPKMAYDEIIITLSSGLSDDSVVRITFPEGLTARDIADLLEENGVCTASNFITALNEHDYSRFDFVGKIPPSENRYLKLEGYIFPDTYEFFTNENVDSVVSKFLRAFDANWTNELSVQAEKMGMTTDEVVTLASIIQKESSAIEEMNMVSGVFHNRLNNADTYPNLQSDVTINYVETDIKPYLNIANQPMYDSYNTYKCTGLPVGPICSPGVAAMKAAIYPEKTNYFYFLTDSEGKYYYAATLEEHEKNDAAASKVGDGKTHGIATQ